MVDVHVAFDAGRRRDGPEHIGLVQAAALMSSKGVQASEGAPALDENALGEAWADLGASFGAEAGRDSFSYSLRSLTQRAAGTCCRSGCAPNGATQLARRCWSNERERWAASCVKPIPAQPPWPTKRWCAHCMVTIPTATR